MIERRTPSHRDQTGKTMTERIFVSGPDPVPLQELVDALVSTGGFWREVKVHQASLSWDRPSTDAEKKEWQEWQAKRLEREEKWERDTYQRLKEKYGDG